MYLFVLRLRQRGLVGVNVLITSCSFACHVGTILKPRLFIRSVFVYTVACSCFPSTRSLLPCLDRSIFLLLVSSAVPVIHACTHDAPDLQLYCSPVRYRNRLGARNLLTVAAHLGSIVGLQYCIGQLCFSSEPIFGGTAVAWVFDSHILVHIT